MWFAVSFASIVVVAALSYYVRYRTSPQFRAKQLELDSYNEKVMSFHEAKEQLSANKFLFAAYCKLTDFYSNEKAYGKDARTKIVLEVMSRSSSTHVATAVCALAKIESNRRLNKNVTKS